MSKIKHALDVVEDLKSLAISLESLVKTMQSNEETPKSEAIMDEEIPIEKVRAVLAEKSQSGKQPEVKALITKYGAQKLTEIDPACYKDLLAEAEVL